ncbi:hypothetical protein [Aliiruegeria lutimaris]|uniref:Uncharacterized protein n=1 Tax=Aliiruegeria lutimaris TaxID=571298 RepID=A0A1G9AWW2_9RHOB|nr:hypothetical protein [Aliiruegeria lutimaris]SDK31200.1 hypothetical protein SAMN04488026_103719 [Aliiruegeria lutimaris]
MPSTISTSAGAFCAVLFASSAGLADGSVVECYDRLYSDDHLLRHPAQSVRRITVALVQDPTEAADWHHWMNVWVRFADQGIGGRNFEPGVEYGQPLRCLSAVAGAEMLEPAGTRCVIEGDGGAMEIVKRQASGLTLRTTGIVLEEPDWSSDQPPAELTAEGNDNVLFRLNRVDQNVCMNKW